MDLILLTITWATSSRHVSSSKFLSKANRDPIVVVAEDFHFSCNWVVLEPFVLLSPTCSFPKPFDPSCSLSILTAPKFSSWSIGPLLDSPDRSYQYDNSNSAENFVESSRDHRVRQLNLHFSGSNTRA